MTRVILIRHGRTTANTAGVLAGRATGVGLDATGDTQVAALGKRLEALPLTHLVSSPLQRTIETARAIKIGRSIPVTRDKQLSELDYGNWTGENLKKLAKHNLWAVVQAHPSAVTFPEGESMAAAQERAVKACRGWAMRASEEDGEQALVAIVSHGDIIKAILADALGMHLDMFQRIVVDPASISVVNYTPMRPFVERINDCGGDVSGLIPRKTPAKRSRNAQSDASIGGGAGPRSSR